MKSHRRQWLQPPRRARISTEAVAMSRVNPDAVPAAKLYAPAPRPDHVAPGLMAMDSTTYVAATSAWAMAGVVNYGDCAGLVFPGYPALAQMSLRPEYRRMTEILAKEMTRRWIKLTASEGGADEQKLAELTAEMQRLRVQEAFRRAAESDGFYGIGHLYVDTGDTNNPAELMTPLTLTKAKVPKGSVRAFRNVEPVWCYPDRYNAQDPLQPDYYRPAIWWVVGKQVHESRLLRFVSREVSDLLKPGYAFGGLSLTQLAQPYVDNWIRTRQSVSDLLHTFSKTVLGTNLSSILQGGDGADVIARAQVYANTRDNRDLIMIDKDTEEFHDVSTPLGTLDKLQAQSLEQLSTVSGIPLVVLLGITPSGLNASSDGEIRVFYAYVKSLQEAFLAPNLDTALKLCQLNLWGEIDPSISYEWVALWEDDETARAAILKTLAEVDQAYCDMGAVSPEEVRERLGTDPDSPYAGLDLSGPAPEPLEDEPPEVVEEIA